MALKLLVCSITILYQGTTAAAENWPRFRGPGGAGISNQQGLPVKWSDDDYAWKTKLPGHGHSSPCVWDDHLFLTSATDDGRTRLLIDVDTHSGDIRWTKATPSKTHEKHTLNSFASGTPATDGKRVYVLFASDEQMLVLAYDFAGKQLWKRNLGSFFQQNAQVHGCGTSPIVFEDLVILANQQDGPSSIVALVSATGKVRWKNDRKLMRTAHSTPIVLYPKGRPPQLFFTNSDDGISSLNPRTGEIIFRAGLLKSRCVGSPVIVGSLVLATCGGGGRGHFLAAIPIGSRGELTAANAIWTRRRNLPYVPTPIAFGEHLFLWGDNGAVVCVQAKTGEEMWTKRVGGNYSGSPVCVDGKLYCVAQDGTVAVINAGPDYKLLGKSELGERCHSTPAIAGGRLFIRGFEHLFCLQAQPATLGNR
jgi:outer membrane protein assembly factor BamB